MLFIIRRWKRRNAEAIFTKLPDRRAPRRRILHFSRPGAEWPAMNTPAAPAAPLEGFFTEEAVFLALANAGRRHLLRRMVAAGGSLTAGESGGGERKVRNLMVKNLTLLASLQIVRAAPDEKDARSLRYTLSPALAVRRTETGWELDFGCAVLRWKSGEESRPWPRPLVRRRRR